MDQSVPCYDGGFDPPEFCVRCNRHKVNNCDSIIYANGNCNIAGHDSRICKRTVDINGNCTRCGRQSHNSNQCRLQTHIK